MCLSISLPLLPVKSQLFLSNSSYTITKKKKKTPTENHKNFQELYNTTRSGLITSQLFLSSDIVFPSMACTSQAVIAAANTYTLPKQRLFGIKYQSVSKLRSSSFYTVKASSEDSDCNVEECAPDKEVTSSLSCYLFYFAWFQSLWYIFLLWLDKKISNFCQIAISFARMFRIKVPCCYAGNDKER